MKTALKVILWVIGIIITLFVILVIALSFIPFNYLKPTITKQVQQATGYVVQFNGGIHLSIFPTLGIKLNDVSVINPDALKNQPIASIKQLKVSVKLLPLLHKNIQIAELSINGMKLNIKQNINGQHNLIPKKPSTKTKTTKQPTISSGKKTLTTSPSATSLKISIPEIDVSNSEVIFTHNKQKIKITNITLSAKNFLISSFFTVKGSLYLDVNQPQTKGLVDFNARIKMSKKHTFVIKNYTLTTKLKGKWLPLKKLDSTINGDIIIINNSLLAKPLNVQLNRCKVNGYIHITNLKTLATKFNLKSTPFFYSNLSGDAQFQGNITAANSGQTPKRKTLNGHLKFQFTNGVYQGINIPYLIQTAQALRLKKTPKAKMGGNDTKFGKLTGTATIENGVIYNNDLVLSGKYIYAKGKGYVNLVKNYLNYKLEIGKPNSNDITTQNIPLILYGPINNPSHRINITKLLQNFVIDKTSDVIKIAPNVVKNVIKQVGSHVSLPDLHF